MASSISAVAQSGLAAASTALAVSANNVANASSTGFVPSRVESRDEAEGGVRVSISPQARVEAGSESGTDLAQEASGQIAAVATYRANLKTLEAADDTSGVLVKLGGDAQR